MDMGKAIKLHNKKTGEALYPITASDMVFDPSTKKSVKADLAEKIGDAPSDGKQYARMDGAWAEIEEASMNLLQIFIQSNQSGDDTLNSVNATVNIDGLSVAVGNGESVVLAKGAEVVISFPEVENYKKPDNIEFTYQGGLVNKTGTYKTEVVSVDVSSDTGESMNGVTVTINGTEYIYNGSAISQKVAYGVAYTVSVGDKIGYITPDAKSLTASQATRNLSIVYMEAQYKLTTIRIDQNISDPLTMINRIVDKGGIEAIRENSHSYTSELQSDGVMKLKQLDDTNWLKYANGSNSLINNGAMDVWMKLPQFWYKCEEYDTDVWDFTVVYGGCPNESFKEWDGKDLIGVFQMGKYSEDEPMAISRPGYTPWTSEYASTFQNYAKQRGEGFSLIKWKHHCMMAMLFYTQYGTTNCQEVIGDGYSPNVTGSYAGSTSIMEDTTAEIASKNRTVVFWGLESWWGDYNEFIGNVTSLNNVMTIVEEDGSERTLSPKVGGFPLKMKFGEFMDLVATELGGAQNVGFCDHFDVSNTLSETCQAYRGGPGHTQNSGISFLYGYNQSSDVISSRLAYRGDFEIVD